MIPLFTVNMPDSVDAPLLKVLHSGYIGEGPKVKEFEALLQEFFGVNALTVNSGTSALTLALRLAGVERGDEVITTPMTCSATNLPILSLGARPVFADVVPTTGNINPASVERLITKNTKVIMAVDWGGTPVNHQILNDLAQEHNLKFIIDAAHSFGGPETRQDRADFVCFSLQAIKHITTVDGGVLLSRRSEDDARGRRLRWFGISREAEGLDSRITEDIAEWGYKFHMNDVAATIGIEQMKGIEQIIKCHRIIANAYDLNISEAYGKPPTRRGPYWLYTLRLPSEALRDKFKSYMADKDIGVSQVHRPNEEYSVFKPYYTEQLLDQPGVSVPIERLAGVDEFSSKMICIPIHTKLTTEDIAYIINSCNDFAEDYDL